jgi:glyoxylate reductase
MENTVFVTRLIPKVGLDQIRSVFPATVWENEEPPTQNEIIELAGSCTGLVTLLSDNIDSNVLNSLPNLKVIAQYAVGYDNIDIKEATRKGIVVTNTPGVLTETAADLTWALIMAASRRLAEADRYVRNGKWKVAWGPQMLLGRDIYGATLGIVGMGRIGSAVARRATGFSMKILYASRSRNKNTDLIEQQTGAIRTSLENLLRESDIITVHVPLTNETKKMIGRAEFNSMKTGSIFVNTSRGAVIDEDALADALESNKLGGAGLDVFVQEPISKKNRLLKMSNVVLAPHIGSASFATRNKMSLMCAKNLIAALSGKKIPNIVNPKALKIMHN